jgi:hypothetical protein
MVIISVKESIHIKQVLIDMDLTEKEKPLQIAQDNSACITLVAESGLRHVTNSIYYSNTKLN